MIKSMTGFGRCEIADEKRKFTVELKSVNHRYLDVNIKMPKKLNFFESTIRNLLKEYIERGKVDVYITYEDYTEDNFALKYNATLAGEYLNKTGQIAIQKGDTGTLNGQTYVNSDTVQQNAEPLYWLTNSVEECKKSGYSREGKAADGQTDIYYRYYVLQLSWKVTDSETDIVYLLASHEE